MAKVVLLANKDVGYKVAQYLLKQKDTEIVALFLTDDQENHQITDLFCDQKIQIIKGKRRHDETEIVSELPDFDYIVSVFWPYLLKKSFLDLAHKSTINFHPALLPLNRGWYPHVYNILDNSQPGVTLHTVDEGIDTGSIWAQCTVEQYQNDTSDKLYYRLQNAIVKLFKEVWMDIVNEKIQPIPQDHSRGSYHSVHDIDKYDQIILDRSYTGKEIIDLLRARTFGDKGFSYFIDGEGEKVSIRIDLYIDQ